jgi:UDP-N-acetylglucosamine--N-acetylmuramyl-(pentapeptide) pyrophosphoryl-undecaprenol N-acetylglucosamine transferase
LDPKLPTVLIIGGGTGSANLNELTRTALPLLTPTCQVLHVAGVGKTEAAVTDAHYRQFDLLTDDLPHAFAAADLVVTRAGLGTLSELAVLGKPTVIIPMAGTHQEANARYFAEHGAAVYLDERELFSKSFADAILNLLADAPRRRGLAAAMKLMNPPDAAAKIAAAVLALIP